MSDKILATFRIAPSIWEQFKNQAAAENTNASALLVEFVQRYLAGDKKKERVRNPSVDSYLDKVRPHLEQYIDKSIDETRGYLEQYIDKSIDRGRGHLEQYIDTYLDKKLGSDNSTDFTTSPTCIDNNLDKNIDNSLELPSAPAAVPYKPGDIDTSIDTSIDVKEDRITIYTDTSTDTRPDSYLDKSALDDIDSSAIPLGNIDTSLDNSIDDLPGGQDSGSLPIASFDSSLDECLDTEKQGYLISALNKSDLLKSSDDPEKTYEMAIAIIKLEVLKKRKSQKEVIDFLNDFGYPTATGQGEWNASRMSKLVAKLKTKRFG